MSSKMHAPIKTTEIEPVDHTKRKVTLRKKRGPKKKYISKEERELRLLTPRMRDLAEGRLSVEDLDFEELSRGQLRDKNGNFTGAKPALLPRAWHERVAREMVLRGESEFRKDFDGALRAMSQLALNERTPSRERFLASQYIIERIMGKIPDKVETKTEVTVFDAAIENGDFLVDLGEDPKAIEPAVDEGPMGDVHVQDMREV